MFALVDYAVMGLWVWQKEVLLMEYITGGAKSTRLRGQCFDVDRGAKELSKIQELKGW